MIELPRAALMAGEIAESAEFFSFGTNDLTQTTFGISRDDAASFLGIYTAARHPAGAIRSCRSTARASASWCGSASSAAARSRKELKVGICGEHGGDPASVGVLPRGRARLRVVLAVPRADRAARRRAGRARQEGRRRGLSASPRGQCAFVGYSASRRCVLALRAGASKSASEGPMAEDGKAAVAARRAMPDPRRRRSGAISDEALRKAEDSSRPRRARSTGCPAWPATSSPAIAVAMSLFHLYAAIAGAWPFHDFPIIATQPLRYTHVAFVLVLSFLLFPMALRFRNRIRWWDVVAGPRRRRDPGLRHRGRRGFHRPRHVADPARRRARRHLHRAAAGGDAPHHRLDRAGRRARVHRLRLFRALSAAALDASRLRRRAARRPSVHHARRHLRRPGRRVVDR